MLTPLASVITGTVVAADELPLSGLGQLGAVGTVLLILFWFVYDVIKRERARADANEAEIKRLNDVNADKTIPALLAAAAALAESNRTLERLRDEPAPRRRS